MRGWIMFTKEHRTDHGQLLLMALMALVQIHRNGLASFQQASGCRKIALKF